MSTFFLNELSCFWQLYNVRPLLKTAKNSTPNEKISLLVSHDMDSTASGARWSRGGWAIGGTLVDHSRNGKYGCKRNEEMET